ncbi:tryptophan halogenase family protein [Kordiimonas aquimaris]|uniref:tryptophan halogenase family protein n=1 Tax=Kordiimonas aquimaris TaxID=707591 RepID=UPI0021D28497|nr:tryptophan halogenase family protein [Kordiimonas aquimaris]
MSQIKKILIVGGGTSGWMTANYLARQLGTNNGGTEITLVESSDIPTVGVGEATIPPIRTLVSLLGFDEAEFMRETSATFKLAIKFDNWNTPAANMGDIADTYYHTFGKFNQINTDLMAPYWVMDREKSGENYVDYTMFEGGVIDAGCGPKRITDPQFQGPMQYAYHFDAGRLAELLKKKGKAEGITQLIGTVDDVKLKENGDIASVITKEQGELTADLYIDCTGFRARLIEGAMGTEFTGMNDVLFCNNAVACQIPYEDPKEIIPPYTTATAQTEGWTWDIPLNNRRGVGYVYSDKYTDKENAEELLRSYLGPRGKDIDVWHIGIRTGKRRQQWKGNCVSIGLSAGFIEPLESTGIFLVDMGLRWLAEFLSTTDKFELAAKDFNGRMNEMYADIIDFIKLHYAITKRTDTEFWVDNANPDTWTTTLQDKLEAWKSRVPGLYEFSGFPQVFGLTNHLQVLYGMDYVPDLSGQEARYLHVQAAREQAQKFKGTAQGGIAVMPKHRDLIEQIYTKGFQPAPNR